MVARHKIILAAQEVLLVPRFLERLICDPLLAASAAIKRSSRVDAFRAAASSPLSRLILRSNASKLQRYRSRTILSMPLASLLMVRDIFTLFGVHSKVLAADSF